MILDPGRGDELTLALLRGAKGSDDIANELLAEFHQGYPINNLRRLLTASDGKIVAAGIWIASELGAGARPLFDDIAELIRHPSAHVRFFALDCLLSCARPGDEQVVDSALDLVEDVDPGVRWKALVLLATLPEALLRAVKQVAMIHAPTGVRVKGIELLLASIASQEVGPLTEYLTDADSDSVLRGYAAAAAVRVAHRDPTPLRQAMRSADTTIKQFAEDMAERSGISKSS